MGKEHSEATDTWMNFCVSRREIQIIGKALNIPCMNQNRLYYSAWGTDQGKCSSVFEHTTFALSDYRMLFLNFRALLLS